jgi:hypothetical protein
VKKKLDNTKEKIKDKGTEKKEKKVDSSTLSNLRQSHTTNNM